MKVLVNIEITIKKVTQRTKKQKTTGNQKKKEKNKHKRK